MQPVDQTLGNRVGNCKLCEVRGLIALVQVLNLGPSTKQVLGTFCGMNGF